MLGRILAVVTVVVCAFGVVALFGGDVVAGDPLFWPILLMAVLAWALFWRPSLRMQEHGVTVQNVFRTHFIPWPVDPRIGHRYSLTIFTVTRKGECRQAAPAPGRRAYRALDMARQGLRRYCGLQRPQANTAAFVRADALEHVRPAATWPRQSAATGSASRRQGAFTSDVRSRRADGDVAH